MEEEELDSLKLKLARWVLSGFEVCLAQVKSDTESECQVGHFWSAELALWDEPNAGLKVPGVEPHQIPRKVLVA